MNYQYIIKMAVTSFGAWAWTVFGPALPYGAACTAMVLADVWTARRIGRPRRDARMRLKFSSARFGRVVVTLIKIYAVLALAALVENVVTGEWVHLQKLTAGIICFWQAVSILENESTAADHPWARTIARYVADKTSRYIDEKDLPPHFGKRS